MITGNLCVIGIAAQKAAAMAYSGEGSKDAERILYEEAMNYIDTWNQAEDELASLLHLTKTRPIPTIVTLGGVIDVTYLLGQPHGFTWKGEFIDAELRAIETEVRSQTTDDRQSLFMKLSGLQGSVLEYKVFEDDLQVSSISTAKLLQLANTQLTPIVTIDQSNIATILPTLSFDQNIKDDITASVGQNLVVRIPQTEMTYLDWTGIGYLKEDPGTGQSGWMLSGSIAGGMTAQSPDKWSSIFNKTVLGNPYNDNSRSVYITSPTNESTVNTSAVVVTGVVLDPEATVTVNGVSADVEGRTFTAAVNLISGSNAIIAVATNKAGRSTFDMIVIRYKILLALAVTYPFDNAALSVSPVFVEGIVSDPSATVNVNGIRGTVSPDGSFIANGIALSEGQNQIVASAMNIDDDLASQTITINYHAVQPQPNLTLSITSPASGATINNEAVTVSGTIASSAQEMSVKVNGILAEIYNGQFNANNVPLTEGSNVIIADAMDANGAISRAQITITASTTAPRVTLSANIQSGVAPLTPYFTVKANIPNTITNYQLDFGDSSAPYTGASFENVSHTYSSEGVFRATVIITDTQGSINSDTITIIVYNKTALEAVFKSTWIRMKTAVLGGNTAAALNEIVDYNQTKYQQIFQALGNAELAAILTNMADPAISFANGSDAEAEVIRDEAGGAYSYAVFFIKDKYGSWKIRGF